MWTIDAVELAQQLGKVAAGLLRSRPRDMMVVAVEPTGRGWNLMIADRSFPDQPVGINLVTVLDNLADGRVPAGLRFRPRRNRWFRRGRS